MTCGENEQCTKSKVKKKKNTKQEQGKHRLLKEK